jgi:hypothetical protein
MKQLLIVVLSWVLLLGASGVASTHSYHSTKTHAARSGTSSHALASRPYYGGGHHTESHGGKYRGSTNGHHKNGHYQNWRTGNSYGVHQAR